VKGSGDGDPIAPGCFLSVIVGGGWALEAALLLQLLAIVEGYAAAHADGRGVVVSATTTAPARTAFVSLRWQRWQCGCEHIVDVATVEGKKCYF